MSGLAGISIGMGVILAALAAPGVVAPSATRGALARFPRSKVAGRLLAAVVLGWSAWLLWQMPLGRFDTLKPLLGVLAPVAYVLTVLLMDELLAARALGGLLCLIPAPILAVSRECSSPWRLAIVIIAYAMAVKGMALVLSPYLFRKGAAFAAATDTRLRTLCMADVLAGVALVALGVFAF